MTENFSGINWTYTQLFPSRGSYTLTDPTQFINNHRKLNYKPSQDVQINLDYLDMLEEISSYPHQINDHLIFGKIFSGHIILENAITKSVYLNQERDIYTLICECQKRLPKSIYLLLEKNGNVQKYNGLNTGNASWHSAVENYAQFLKNIFSSLLKDLNYENLDYRELKKSFMEENMNKINSRLPSEIVDNLHYRIVHFKNGYYELTSKYPKFDQITKSSVVHRLADKIKNNYRALDNSYGIYYVSHDQKLYKVMPTE